jgi:hypothetical protein
MFKIQTFNGLPIHRIGILHEKEKEKYGSMGFIFQRQKKLVIAHQDKHFWVGYVAAQKEHI